MLQTFAVCYFCVYLMAGQAVYTLLLPHLACVCVCNGGPDSSLPVRQPPNSGVATAIMFISAAPSNMCIHACVSWRTITIGLCALSVVTDQLIAYMPLILDKCVSIMCLVQCVWLLPCI